MYELVYIVYMLFAKKNTTHNSITKVISLVNIMGYNLLRICNANNFILVKQVHNLIPELILY